MKIHWLKDVCPNCNEIFALDEGMGSKLWHNGKPMCEKCLSDEAWEIEYPDQQPKLPKSVPLRPCGTKNA